MQPKPWTIGALFRQQWSIIGPNGRTDVNQSLLQPFVSYNLPDGWNLSTGPVITANWSADQSQRWTVPVGGGFGKIFKIGKQPVSASLRGFYYNAERLGFRAALVSASDVHVAVSRVTLRVLALTARRPSPPQRQIA